MENGIDTQSLFGTIYDILTKTNRRGKQARKGVRCSTKFIYNLKILVLKTIS